MKVKDSWGERTEAEREEKNKYEKGHIKVNNNSHNYLPTAKHQIARCNIATTNQAIAVQSNIRVHLGNPQYDQS